ncbi:MAG: LLM class flavin-dependent oxidoreductase [Armatimonadota bacterium]|nr:LLM class flavin-dependent oxidoreductase [Armatimonadota bacterium]MDR7427629.1 LLM class flavin-dependent oxidoreductase [Armatimonadota bacterium]MDR7469597.1 LLM class flavin-dependent oxidoreductase [Armatimonadota bacterium]MDR7476000.1 LLM class flavin-dependent oxidoreductase [Armatimonadota bacterium]MDR7538317.1 LLM class flavin-dependent oxidoreductase [Armatimonadota bacterium]
MEFGIRLPHSGPLASPDTLRTVARRAEELGYAALLTHDHVNWGLDDRYHFYFGGLELADAHPRPTAFYDAFTTMAYLAGMTTRIRFVSSAIVLAWRHPLMVARLALTLHHLSGGRFVLGVCVGNVPRDFEVLGVDWERRAELAEEHLEVLARALRQPGLLSHQGCALRFTDAELEPKAPDLPIWYGGTAPQGLARAARYCEGLIVGGPPDQLRTLRDRVLALRQQYGREHTPFTMAALAMISIAPDPATAEATAARTLEERERAAWLRKQRRRYSERDSALVGTPAMIMQRLREYQTAGVDFMGLGFVGPSCDAVLERIALFAEEVLPQLRCRVPSQGARQ